MFLEKYLNDFYYDQVINNYEEEYLNSLDESNFLNVYNLFKEQKFYFIDDIILKYLEIFSMDVEEVQQKIRLLKEKLGENFVYIIGNNMRYLNEVIY